MIPVRNIYWMLAYAFSALRGGGYASLACEEFDSAADLLAAILARGISHQAKRGLRSDYVAVRDETCAPRGRLDVSASVKANTPVRGRLVCEFDEFTADNRLNQVLKTAGLRLLSSDAGRERKRELRRSLDYLAGVSAVDPRDICWHLRFDRGTRTYQMLYSVCYLALNGLIQTEDVGRARLEAFGEDDMARLYERFVREYLRAEHGCEVGVSAPHIPWMLDDGNDKLLPVMRSDIVLESCDGGVVRQLIIDTKYYSRILGERYGKQSLHSGNLYQVFAYVKNTEERLCREGVEHEISGMLLYARTDEDAAPCETYRMSGNSISVATLDLNQPFEGIRAQLDGIALSFLEAGGRGTDVDPTLGAALSFCGRWLPQLESGHCSLSAFVDEAYEMGAVAADYAQRIEGLSPEDVLRSEQGFVERLEKGQLVGAIGWHIRQEHWSWGAVRDSVNSGALPRLMRALLTS